MSSLILNFHGVGPVTRDIDGGEYDCWLDQNFFESVLDASRGHHHVQFTFDDGNISDATIALPALLRRGLRATFFVCSDRLEQPEFLGQSHTRTLRSAGMTIGSHGRAHVTWRHLPSRQLVDEVESSKHILEQACLATVEVAACPFGEYDRTVLHALQRAGYKNVYTSDGGRAKETGWLKARNTMRRTMQMRDIEHLIQCGHPSLNQATIDLRTFYKRLR